MSGRTGTRPVARTVRSALVGAVAARTALAAAAALDGRPLGAPWRRMNYAGRPVTLLGGPALAASATASAVLGAPPGTRTAAAVVGAVSGLVGAYDDLAGARPDQARDKGLAGHFAALRAGRVSAGAVKVAGIGAAAAAAAALTRRGAGAGALLDGVLTTGLVAGTANLVNLLDLRPGRAGKAGVLAAAAGLGGPGGGLVAGPSALLSRSCRPTWASGSCSATPARTPSVRCSGCGSPRSRRALPEPGCWPPWWR
ncbi:hypothetical protein [Blastococcus brunescens]|uniref:Uncharacterized protein n=1 Tax=Blastococcus brunescens TaxID=1564165 RepID=A0ABZ1B690_9ACTN|nr:hypothetical protein [Blastococcus sp. BMG 8361]WRL66330.1 hypothetical protein U6N30_13330 [Blastococcus sp. BMG 8361]